LVWQDLICRYVNVDLQETKIDNPEKARFLLSDPPLVLTNGRSRSDREQHDALCNTLCLEVVGSACVRRSLVVMNGTRHPSRAGCRGLDEHLDRQGGLAAIDHQLAVLGPCRGEGDGDQQRKQPPSGLEQVGAKIEVDGEEDRYRNRSRRPLPKVNSMTEMTPIAIAPVTAMP
jgi:hypothetical protein